MTNVITFPPRKADDIPAYLESLAKRLRDKPDDAMRFVIIMEDAGSMESNVIGYDDKMAAIGAIEAVKIGLVMSLVEADD